MKYITELELQDKIHDECSWAKFILDLALANSPRLTGRYDCSRRIIWSLEVNNEKD